MKRISHEEFQKEIENIVGSLEKYNPEKVVLFGSFARGDYDGMSDIDLIIIKKTGKRFVDRIGEVLELCDYNIPIEPYVYTPEEVERMLEEGNSFLKKALEEGRIIYEAGK